LSDLPGGPDEVDLRPARYGARGHGQSVVNGKQSGASRHLALAATCESRAGQPPTWPMGPDVLPVLATAAPNRRVKALFKFASGCGLGHSI